MSGFKKAEMGLDDEGALVYSDGAGRFVHKQLQKIVVPITFDMPDLVLTGIPIYTPTPGDIVPSNIGLMIWISESWDGSTPTLHFGMPDEPRFYSDEDPYPLPIINLSNQLVNTGGISLNSLNVTAPDNNIRFSNNIPVIAMVDDWDGNGSPRPGSDPESTQGAAEIVLYVWPAS